MGERPLGWYCRYGPSVNTRRLVVGEGGFLYDSDYYGDELPFWKTVDGRPHLIVPYSLTNNDGKYAGWVGTSDEWFAFIRDAFDMLYKEGAKTPKMMSVGLHMRLIGHPARAAGLERLLDYILKQDGVWVTRRLDIARHWMTTHPFGARGSTSSCCTKCCSEVADGFGDRLDHRYADFAAQRFRHTPEWPAADDDGLGAMLCYGLLGQGLQSAFEFNGCRHQRDRITPYGQKIGTAEEPVLDRAIELAGAQSWGDG